ncbi:MAG: hypothetical protein WC137_00840 [Alphaproteobacteria bacterium]
MKNLLVYLHGFGSHGYENLKFQKKLAKQLDAHLLSPQAELASGRARGGFGWYPISENWQHDLHSDWFVGQQGLIYYDIKTKLKELKLDWNSVILSGRSQGAFMALKTALGGVIPQPKLVISFNGYYIDKSLFQITNTNIPVLWGNSKYDQVLSEDLKNSHTILSGKGINTKIMTLDNSNHDMLSLKDIRKIVVETKRIEVAQR